MTEIIKFDMNTPVSKIARGLRCAAHDCTGTPSYMVKQYNGEWCYLVCEEHMSR